jgi:hypothetical protein
MGRQVDVDRSAMIRLFEDIRDAFPRLRMRLDDNPENVDLEMVIPQQLGLAFEINLNLQGDELHLSSGAFWLEWFPCTRQEIVEAYRDAVHGLITGSYRIREHHRGGRPFKAELQIPVADSWQTIGTTSWWTWPLPRRTVKKVVQNV